MNLKPSGEYHLTGDQSFWHRASLPLVFSRVFTPRICGFPDTKFSHVEVPSESDQTAFLGHLKGFPLSMKEFS